jgi:putative Holliday junction resolvase
MPDGVWYGVDVGTVRVGVARSDPRGVLAMPMATLRRDTRHDSDITQLAAVIAEQAGTERVAGVVVGLPRTLRAAEGPSAAMAREYAARLARAIAPIAVELTDERLTTVAAQRKLAGTGVRGSRATRTVIDQAAAVELLQLWLDSRRR